MSNRDKNGDIILTEEERNQLYYRLTHPDVEAIAQRDNILEDSNRKFTTKFNEDGSMECFKNIDYTNPGPVDDPQYITSFGTRKLLQNWQDMIRYRAQEYTRPLLDVLEDLNVEITDEVRTWANNKVCWISDVDFPYSEDNADNTFTVTIKTINNKEYNYDENE